MDWFGTPPLLRALGLAFGALLVVSGGLAGLLRSRDAWPWDARLARATVPRGHAASGGVGLAGLARALHPWSPLLGAATGLAPVALMVLVAWGVPAIRARPEVALPPPPLPEVPGRLPPRPEDP